MENTERLTNYIVLLKIRQKANHRDTIITGVLLVIALVVTTATIFLTEWSGPSIWMAAVFNTLVAASYAITRARYEAAKESIEFANLFQLHDRA